MKRAANPNGPPELVDRIYAVAVEPKRLEELADVWDARIRQLLQTDPEALALLQRPDLETHVERADDVLRRLGMDREPARSPLEAMLEEIPTAALVATPLGVIVAANRAASAILPAAPGKNLAQLGFRYDDLEALLGRLATAARGAADAGELLRFRLPGSGRLVIIQLRGAPADVLAGNVLLVTTELTWPAKLGTLLRDAFELTAAETEVLQLLSQGLNAGEIGPATGRAEATIRSHIRALLAKTGARSQTELIRVTLGLMDVARTTEGIAPADLVRLPGQLPNEYHTIRLADGRRYDYLEIGDRDGRPFLWLPKNYGLCRWTVEAEKALAERGLRMIATVRAGYGYSSPPPARSDVYETAAHDVLELMDQLGIAACPVATLGDDIRIAVTMACAAPRRVKAIVACGATMPANRPEHYARMPKWPRFIRGNARYAPMVLPFLLRAGFGMLRRAGGKAFMQTILGSSPADLAALEDEAIMTAMVIGSQITLSEHVMAHAAYAAEMIAFQQDWEPLLARCPVAITLFNGREDPHTPFETAREFLDKYPTIRLVDIPRQGHLAFMTHWRELISNLEKAV